MVDREQVEELVCSRKFDSMTTKELSKHLGLTKDDQDELVGILEELQLQGHVVRIKGHHWVSPLNNGMLVGRLDCNQGGFGFVCPLQGDIDDVYVAEEDLGPAMHNDLVVLEYHRSRKKGRRDRGPAGRIVKVLVHENETIVGSFMPGKKFSWVAPDEPRLFRDIYIAKGDECGAEAGQKVVVRVTSWPTLHRNPEGEVVRILGKEGEPGVDVQSVIVQFGLPQEFPEDVKKAAAQIPEDPSEHDKWRRLSQTKYTTVTIDPEDAKDYDDALSLYRDVNSGNRVALVHIADCSHFIEPDGILDMEARDRGCSVYLASDVVPMLPERQSRDVLSLIEGKERLAKTVALEYDDDGELLDYSVFHSVVEVDERMTYTEVQQILDALDDEDNPASASVLAKVPDDVVDLIQDLDHLAKQLRERRTQVGSVDLDVPEYDVSVNEKGEVISVTQIVRDPSHGLVEELMLAANCAVADFCKSKKLPALYRVHNEPEKEDLMEFSEFVMTVVGESIDARDRKQLQRLLTQVSDTPLREAVNMQLLRSMQRAQYDTTSDPHYALNFEDYCHFTSPVRRYPDLVIHQILDQHLREDRAPGELRAQWKKKLSGIATHCNERQYRADEAEREIVKIKLLRYLQDHLHEVFDGVITGVEEFGLFVRLQEYSLEGLVRVDDMKDDFYKLDPKHKALVGSRTNKTYQLGQSLSVVLDRIDMTRREADFLIHDD